MEDDCVLCLIGNKVDLCPTEDSRVLKYKDGVKLADVRTPGGMAKYGQYSKMLCFQQSGALFFETSAQTGAGVHESMQAMAM